MSQFQAATLAAVYAIREQPGDELDRFCAIRAWEDVRASIRTLSEREQRIASETLNDRQFPTIAFAKEIAAFMVMKGGENTRLDEELSTLTRAWSTPSS